METVQVDNYAEQAFGILLGPRTIHIHDAVACSGHCPFHNPTDHHMKDWPTVWRDDRKILERTCSHGIGHPDPDDRSEDKVHGCDGCCNPPLQEKRMATLESDVRKAINYLFQKNGTFTLPDVKKEADRWGTGVGVILSKLASSGETVRISRGLYTLPEGKVALAERNPNGSIYDLSRRKVSFENVKEHILEFNEFFTVSDVRLTFNKDNRPNTQEVVSVLKELRTQGQVASTGGGYWSVIRTEQKEDNQVEPVTKDEVPTEEVPTVIFSPPPVDTDYIVLPDGRTLEVDESGDIWTVSRTKVGHVDPTW